MYIFHAKEVSVVGASTSLDNLVARLRERGFLHLGITDVDMEYDADRHLWWQAGDDGLLEIRQFKDTKL